MAGGGSLLSVPVLISLGLPPEVANGTNRVGVIAQTLAAAWRFRAEKIRGAEIVVPLVLPIAVGAVLGAYGISLVDGQSFRKIFGLLMIVLLIPTLRATRPQETLERIWRPTTRTLVFFAIGLYGGALQAGVGLLLIMALSHAGVGLVIAQHVKVLLILALTLLAMPVFILQGQLAWAPGLTLALGFGFGGTIGAQLTVLGGERIARIALLLAVIGLSGRMLGLY